MDHPVAAAVIGVAGSAVAGVGTLVAQAAPSAGGGDLIPWAQVGGSGIAVSILGFIAKKMLDGELVARATVDREARLNDHIERSLKREEVLERIVDNANEREDSFRILLVNRQGGNRG